jgi:outer membrane protein
MLLSLRCLAALCVALAFSGATAEEPPPRGGGEERALRGSIGAAVLAVPRPYVGADDEVLVIPLIELEYGRFFARGIFAGASLWERERWSLALVGQPRFSAVEPDDSAFLRGMEERDTSFDLGLELTRRWRKVSAELAVLTDLLGRHDGQEVRAGLSFPRRFQRVLLLPQVGVSWQSERLVDYYYGIRADEARPLRPAYDAGGALNVSAGVLAQVRLAPRWQALGLVQLERLGDGITDSPIVDEDLTVLLMAGLGWRF